MGIGNKMIRIGFIGAVSKEWMGGLNYYKNLLYAISTVEDQQIEPIVFVGKNTDTEIKNMFKQYAKVVEHSMFDSKSVQWYAWKVLHSLFGSLYLLDKLLMKNDIKVLSHSNLVGLKSCKIINWIPDFQHLHLPKMFSSDEMKYRNTYFMKLIQKSDLIILSSYDALKDLKTYAPDYLKKARVLQFVSQPSKLYFNRTDDDEKSLREKYGLDTEFFYMPNQFWAHKNHKIVFEAVKMLKEKGSEIQLICSGHMSDYRNKKHMDELKDFIKDNKLTDNIKLLGLVDYEDVFALIKFSKAVVNPSLFEGWSSTVEECKSVGKNMILSDLDVHKEQYPEALFFERNTSQALANLLEKYQPNDQVVKTNLEERTKAFAKKYISIVKESLND